MRLTMEEKLRIANMGGQFQENGPGTWVGTKIRKGTKLGVVTADMNGAYRILTVTFEDNTIEEIEMNNIGLDPEYIHVFEWLCKVGTLKDKWIRF